MTTKTQWIRAKCMELNNNNLLFKIFEGNNIMYENILKNNLEPLFNKILSLYSVNLYLFSYKITHRKTDAGYYQNWHIDGRRVFENRPGMICPTNPNNQTQFVLHTIFNPIPKYSILFYNSDYNKEFKGGTIEFINNQIIKPRKNMCVFFDSNLGHRVNLQTSGERECILILFFDN
jgi:hypothetical protein